MALNDNLRPYGSSKKSTISSKTKTTFKKVSASYEFGGGFKDMPGTAPEPGAFDGWEPAGETPVHLRDVSACIRRHHTFALAPVHLRDASACIRRHQAVALAPV